MNLEASQFSFSIVVILVSSVILHLKFEILTLIH